MVLLTLAICAGLIWAAEAAVRNREANRATVPGNTPSAFYRHNRLRTALVRNQDYYGWFRVNRLGLRGPEIELEAPPGTFRVLAVGASTTFETQVTGDERTWPVRLEHWLEAELPGRDVQVLNAGVPGYTVFDNVVRLQMELFQFRPDLILLLSGHNDVSCAIQGRRTVSGDRPYQVLPESRLTTWLQQNSELYNKVKSRLAAIRFTRAGNARPAVEPAGAEAVSSQPPGPASPVASHPLRCGEPQYRRDVTSFVALAQSLGFEVALVQALHVSGSDATHELDTAVQAVWRNARPYVEPDSALRMHVRYRGILDEVAAERGVAFIPTGGFGISGLDLYGYRDPMHFNDEGADRMGRAMARALIELGLVTNDVRPSAPPPPPDSPELTSSRRKRSAHLASEATPVPPSPFT